MAAYLALATAAVLFAGDGFDAAVTTNTPCDGFSVSNLSTNALCLWIDVPTNTSRAGGSIRAEGTATNFWLPPGMNALTSTSSAWRTTATLETGFFHVGHVCGPGCFGSDRRSENGWFQEVGVGTERDIDHGDSAISVGFGVSVGRATLRGP